MQFSLARNGTPPCPDSGVADLGAPLASDGYIHPTAPLAIPRALAVPPSVLLDSSPHQLAACKNLERADPVRRHNSRAHFAQKCLRRRAPGAGTRACSC